jgi:hypothetical protein
MRLRTPRWCCAILATVALTSSARAADPPRVGVAWQQGDDACRARLLDELSANGFDVRDADEEEKSSLGRSGLSAHMVVRAHRIEVRVAKRKDGRFELREAVVDLGQNEEEAATASMRAVEFLRASLYEIGLAPPKPKPPVREATPVPKPPASEPQDHRQGTAIGLGAGFVHSIGGVGGNAVVTPALSFRLWKSGGLRMVATIPVSSAKVTGPEGDVAVKPTIFGISAYWVPLRTTWLSAYGEAGVGAAVVSTSAHAAAGYQANDETPATMLPFLGLGVSIGTGRVTGRLGAIGGTALTRQHVHFVGREVARWGAWVTGATATLEIVID